MGLKQSQKREHYQLLRKPGRDPQSVIHARPGASHFLIELMQQPAVKLALQKLRKERSAVLNVAVAETDIDGPPYCFAESAGDGVNTGGDAVDTDDAEDNSAAEQPTKPTNLSATCAKNPVEWPKDVHKPLNPDRITFRDLGDLGKCPCVDDCYIDQCLNSQADVVCTKRNCAIDGSCSGAISDCISLSIFQTADKGIGLYTVEPIEVGKIVGEYYGLLHLCQS